MGPIVYVDLLSPCSQSVALLTRLVPGLEAVTVTEISLQNGDHKKPEFVMVRTGAAIFYLAGAARARRVPCAETTCHYETKQKIIVSEIPHACPPRFGR